MTATEENHIRLFVAIPVPALMDETLKSLQHQNSSLNGIRWTPIPNLHITIFFLGEISELNCSFVKQAVSKVIENSSPFHLDFEKITLTGKNKYGRMIWAQFRKHNSFASLSNGIFEAVEPYLILRRFIHDPVPHITLARMKTEPVSLNLNSEKLISLPEVNSCELWKTVHGKYGVVYDSLEQFRFGK
jgi:2'-5' RNA ligase